MICIAGLSALDHDHYQMIILGSLVAEVPGHPPQEIQTEVAGWEGVQHPALLRGLVTEADHTGCVLLLEITHKVFQRPGLALLAFGQRNCGWKIENKFKIDDLKHTPQ